LSCESELARGELEQILQKVSKYWILDELGNERAIVPSQDKIELGICGLAEHEGERICWILKNGRYLVKRIRLPS
jgi:hypothetical protein